MPVTYTQLIAAQRMTVSQAHTRDFFRAKGPKGALFGFGKLRGVNDHKNHQDKSHSSLCSYEVNPSFHIYAQPAMHIPH